MSVFVKLCKLWEKQTKEGKTIMSGYMGAAKVVILPNKEKKENTDPDYNLFVVNVPKYPE